MAPEEYTRQDIEVLNEASPYNFESAREEQWFKVGLQYGLEVADADPLLQWISVKDDLPCNHKELLSEIPKMVHSTYVPATKNVLVVLPYGIVKLVSMVYNEINNKWEWDSIFENDIIFWMPIPELPKEGD